MDFLAFVPIFSVITSEKISTNLSSMLTLPSSTKKPIAVDVKLLLSEYTCCLYSNEYGTDAIRTTAFPLCIISKECISVWFFLHSLIKFITFSQFAFSSINTVLSNIITYINKNHRRLPKTRDTDFCAGFFGAFINCKKRIHCVLNIVCTKIYIPVIQVFNQLFVAASPTFFSYFRRNVLFDNIAVNSQLFGTI